MSYYGQRELKFTRRIRDSCQGSTTIRRVIVRERAGVEQQAAYARTTVHSSARHCTQEKRLYYTLSHTKAVNDQPALLLLHSDVRNMGAGTEADQAGEEMFETYSPPPYPDA